MALCHFWKAGKCRNGASCRFLHGERTHSNNSREIHHCEVDDTIALNAASFAVNLQVTWENGAMPTLQCEREMETILVLNVMESGRGIYLPAARLQAIEAAAATRNFTIQGALSLRRQFLRQVAIKSHENFYSDLDMGDPSAANLHAARFETLLEDHLARLGVPHWRESHLYSLGSRNTPDFLLRGNIEINGVTVRWIDCKTYFGSSLLASNPRLPIGKLLQQADRYNRAFCRAGETGCFIFLCGASAQLGEQLTRIAGGAGHFSGPLPLILNSFCIDTTSLWDAQRQEMLAEKEKA